MRTWIVAALSFWALLVPPAAGAPDAEPQLYFFWSASCPFSQNARSFLQNAQSRDPKLRVHDFEVDRSLSNALLLAKVYERIGLPESWVVPLVVVGHQFIVGYLDDETTGREILDNVANCRKTRCSDAVRDLIDGPRAFDQVSASTPARPVACANRPGQ